MENLKDMVFISETEPVIKRAGAIWVKESTGEIYVSDGISFVKILSTILTNNLTVKKGFSNYIKINADEDGNSRVVFFKGEGSFAGAVSGVGDDLIVESTLNLKLSSRTSSSGVVICPTSLFPSQPQEGMICANSSDHHLYYYNGTDWKQLDNEAV